MPKKSVSLNCYGVVVLKTVLEAAGYKVGEEVYARFFKDGSPPSLGTIIKHHDGWAVRCSGQPRYSSILEISPVSSEESTASSSNAPAVKGTEDMTTNVHVVESVVGEKSVTDTETGKPLLETVVLRAPAISVEGVNPPLNVQEWIHANNAAVTSAGVSVSTIRVLRSTLPKS